MNINQTVIQLVFIPQSQSCEDQMAFFHSTGLPNPRAYPGFLDAPYQG